MFYLIQDQISKDRYKSFLKTVGSLSNLFSDNSIPYLYYRAAENIFCSSFDAENLGRSDVSADAKKLGQGIGLKTFLAKNHNTYQKIAEFNAQRPLYKDLSNEDLIHFISKSRNKRLVFTERLHQLDNSIYHCVLREGNEFKIFEEPMDLVDIANIKIKKKNLNSIVFEDGINEYSFHLSKSTLTKRFKTSNIIDNFEIEIFADPIAELQTLFQNSPITAVANKRVIQTIFLPLYGRNQTVFEKSGLNQWNASGRDRNANEVYIPIPALIQNKFSDFFPGRDKAFDLILPSGEVLRSKVCQDGRKALMSYSNKRLGEWILRDVLNLQEGNILTYKKLQEIGVDSVRLDKISDGTFEINFTKIDSFEKFESQFK